VWELYRHLAAGDVCWVQGAGQSSTTVLVERIAARLRADGLHVAALDPALIGSHSSPEEWYAALLQSIADQLDPSGRLFAELDLFCHAHAHLGPFHRWMAALQRVVLPNLGIGSRVLGIGNDPATEPSSSSTSNTQHPTPRLVIFFGGIDVVAGLPFSADELFAGIRECHNRRAQHPALQGLTFCLLGTSAPSELIRDPRATPFNIGVRIELVDAPEKPDSRSGSR
jgi:hypothetical protein